MASTAWPLRGSCRRAYALISLALLASIALGTSAMADAEPTSPPPRPDYGIRPGFYGDTSLPGDHYTFALTPGTSIDDTVVIFNYTDEASRYDVYGADLILAEGGGFAPASRDVESQGSGAWITPSTTTVEVPAGSRLSVPFSVAIPVGAAPGDHPGALVVEPHIASRSQGVTVQPRLALRVQLTVPGDVDLGVALGSLNAERLDDAVRFTVPITNTGNVTFTAAGTVTVVGRGDPIELDLRPDGLYAIPGGEATLWSIWQDPPWIGRVRAHSEVSVVVGDREPVPYTTDTITLWLIPWRTLGVAFAVAILLGVLLVTTRHRRAQRRRRRREERVLLRDFRERWKEDEPIDLTQREHRPRRARPAHASTRRSRR